MAVTLKYETKACGRCGGSGHYSYCSMYGTTCFACRGRKTVLSKAGAKAAAAVDAFIKAHFSMPVDDLKPGDRIKVDGVYRTVDTVATSGGSRYGVKDPATGDMVWKDYITVTFTKPVKGLLGSYSSHGFCSGTTVVKAVAGADWDAVVAFAKTLKKGVTLVEKTPAAVAS